MSGFNKSRKVYYCPTCGQELYKSEDGWYLKEETVTKASCKNIIYECGACQRVYITGIPSPKYCNTCPIRVECLSFEPITKGRRKR